MCAYQIGEHLHLTFSDHLDLYSQQASEETTDSIISKMLSSLSCLVSNRSSVMKKSNTLFNERRENLFKENIPAKVKSSVFQTRQNKFESILEIIESVVSSPFVKAEVDSDRTRCCMLCRAKNTPTRSFVSNLYISQHSLPENAVKTSTGRNDLIYGFGMVTCTVSPLSRFTAHLLPVYRATYK
jgi:hypothetical protein